MIYQITMLSTKNWCFQIVVLEKTLKAPWKARRSNRSILKEINPEYSLGLMLKLKFQYFGHLIQRTDSLGKTLMLEKTEDRRGRGWQRMRWLDGITNLTDMNFSRVRELVVDREAWCAAAVHGVTKRWTRLSNWTKLMAWNPRLLSEACSLPEIICICFCW